MLRFVRMGLKVLCAGCSKDERQDAEAAVRQALGKRTENGAWMVSLVRITGQWSVTLDAPTSGIRALTVVAPEGRLRESIVEALEPPGAPPPPPQRATVPADGRSPAECEECRRAFVVIYEAAADDSQESAPVACPHCWHVNYVLVGETAAETKDYRAEKV